VIIPRGVQCQIIDIVPAIERARLYRGRGAELIRFAVCKLIEAIATMKFSLNLNENEKQQMAKETKLQTTKRPPIPRKEKTPLQQYLETLEENLKHPQVLNFVLVFFSSLVVLFTAHFCNFLMFSNLFKKLLWTL
jgi:hypothetical protein